MFYCFTARFYQYYSKINDPAPEERGMKRIGRWVSAYLIILETEGFQTFLQGPRPRGAG